ncbi:MAG TPA: hypothetical protein DCE47_16975 [Planctomycetaceae bacterium]|nr:hypothetical protein [Planctomycetaceae bacterium]
MARISLFTTIVATAVLPLCSGPASAQVGGVRIDASGLLHRVAATSSAPPIAETPGAFARRDSNRKLSLKRLEAAIADHLESDRPLPDSIRYLAGLQRIDEVLLNPEQGDVVLVGPAAGWTRLPSGEVVDPESHRPVLELDDLALALRFSASTDRDTSFIGCSIDPTRDGLKRYARYLKGLSGSITPRRIPKLVQGMQRAMGPQDVRIFGVPADSRFACKLVAADYRLKRVAMGFDRPPIKGLVNYVDLLAKANPSAVRRQHRFWFVAIHDGLSRSPDSRTWRFSGSCLAVRTAASSSGDEDDDRKASPIAKRMAANLTSRFTDLARHIPVFADLENLVRLTVATEIALHAPLPASARRWRSRLLVEPKRFRRRTSPAPRRVSSLASIRKARGRNWVLSVSGGVKVEPPPIRQKDLVRVDRQLVRSKHHAPTSGAWWWD